MDIEPEYVGLDHNICRWQLPGLTPEEKQVSLNRSRNYIRFMVSKNRAVDPRNPTLTPEEAFLIAELNTLQELVTSAKMAFFLHFYINCPKVGSTLKPTSKSRLQYRDEIQH